MHVCGCGITEFEEKRTFQRDHNKLTSILHKSQKKKSKFNE